MKTFLEDMSAQADITLYLPSDSGYQPLHVVVDKSSYRIREIMGQHTLNLKFSLPGYVDIPVGTYCVYGDLTYTLESPENMKKHGERNFSYDLTLQSDQYKLNKFMVRNIVPGDTRLKFSYTARPHEFLYLLVENMNNRDEDKGWSIGEGCIESYEKTVSFNHNTCAEALGMIAEAFDTEWEVSGKIIYLRKVEHYKDKPLSLSYGRGKGFLPGVGQSEYTEAKQVQRLFIQGGERNIDPSKYRKNEVTGQIVSTTLLMPAVRSIKYDGHHFEGDKDEQGVSYVLNPETTREYITDKSGASVTRVENKGTKSLTEGSLDCSEIYPMREGTISFDASKSLFDFTDIDPRIPDYSKNIIPGQTMTVIFQNGMLAGKEFDVSYVHPGKFKIVPQTIDGVDMPGEAYIPQDGGKYRVFNVKLPDEDVKEAELEVLKQAVRYLYDNEQPRYSFTGTLDGKWAKDRWESVGDRLIPGGYIRFSDDQFLKDGMDIRITAIKDYVTNPYKPEIELSNNSRTGSWVHNMKRKIESDEVTTETRDKQVIQYAERKFRDVGETMTMLEESLLDFSQGVKPITVQTMHVVVGDESLQFEYSADSLLFRFEAGTGMICPEGTLTHKTIGIKDITTGKGKRDYPTWDMPGVTLIPEEPDKAYYLYAKVEKSEAINPDRKFVLSDSAIPMESLEDQDHYYLLVGILTSEEQGKRYFSPIYGFTEIAPGRITTNKLVSQDGDSYFDLENAQMLLGDEGYTQGMDFGVTTPNQLTLKGKIDVDKEAVISGWRFTNNDIRSENDYFVLKPSGSMNFYDQEGQNLGSIANMGAGLFIQSHYAARMGEYLYNTGLNPFGCYFSGSRSDIRMHKSGSSDDEMLEVASKERMESYFRAMVDKQNRMVVDISSIPGTLRFRLAGLPLSSAGLISGTVYSENGFLKIR